ncbi:MAG TPA: hypothetical protein VL181_07960 [Holophagaceae bacterium]|nr:hypothetical protein [Holophagaceae bacterium]
MLGTEYFLQTEWSEAERIHFPSLSLIRSQLPTPTQVEHLEGLARNLSSPRLLALMCRTPHWLCQGPILQSLAQNDATPEVLRRDLDLVVSLLAMMRELDSAPAAEKVERAEVVKATYAQLSQGLKPVAKVLAKQLAKPIAGTGSTQELPSLPGDDQDWDALLAVPESPRETLAPEPQAPPEARATHARNAGRPEDLVENLLDEDPSVRAAAMENPHVNEELLARTLPYSPHPAFFEEVYGEARWYFRDSVRAAMLESPACPEALTRKLARSFALLQSLAAAPRETSGLRRIASLFAQLEESEFQYVTYWCKRQAPQLLRVVKYYYDRLQRRQSSLQGALPQRASEGRWASLEERVFAATQATAADQLMQALLDPDLHVVRLALENPALSPRILVSAVPSLTKEAAELVASHRAWGEEPPVLETLLLNGQLGEAMALQVLEGVTGFRPLLELLRNPRMPHLEVKRRAQLALKARYDSLDEEGRVQVLRASGGEVWRHLPELLQDEATLRRLVSDRQLDPSLLLRLARNKLTPRAVLEVIAGHPVLLAQSAVMSELLLNPKTPREAAARVWGLLSESEQQVLLRSPHLPATLRALSF